MPSPPVLIASAADERFFPFLAGLLFSLRAQEIGKRASLGVLDLGLAEPQRRWLAKQVDSIVTPDWDLEVPDSAREKPHLKALIARLFLPRYFPGFRRLCLARRRYLAAGRRRTGALPGRRAARTARRHAPGRPRLSARPERRALAVPRPGIKLRPRSGRRAHAVSLRQCRRFRLGGPVAALVRARHLARRGHRTLRRRQLGQPGGFNHAIYHRRLPVQLLPAICNWQCHLCIPAWNEEEKVFCEPYLPHRRISMLHLTADSKDKAYAVKTLSGRTQTMSLRYPLPTEAVTSS